MPLCDRQPGALIRFLLRIGESVGVSSEVVRRLRTNPVCEFWPDSVSCADADLKGVHGHRQVTGAYLVALTPARAEHDWRRSTAPSPSCART